MDGATPHVSGSFNQASHSAAVMPLPVVTNRSAGLRGGGGGSGGYRPDIAWANHAAGISHDPGTQRSFGPRTTSPSPPARKCCIGNRVGSSSHSVSSSGTIVVASFHDAAPFKGGAMDGAAPSAGLGGINPPAKLISGSPLRAYRRAVS